MSKGTIIYIGGFELPDKNAAAHRVISNAKILTGLGYKVIFMGISKNQDNLLVNVNYFNFDGWHIKYPKTIIQWYKFTTSINLFKEVFRKYDNIKSVICYNLQAIAFYKLLKFGKKRNVNIYADITEWYGVQGKNILLKVIKGIDSFVRMRILNKQSSGIIAISKYLYDYYSKHTKTILVPPLIDINEKKWNTLSHNNNYEEKEIKFIYFGNMGSKKDKINYFIDTLYYLKNTYNFLFQIIGITKEQYENIYPYQKEILKELGTKIEFYGFISHLKVIEILKKSNYSIIIREDNIVSKAGFPTKFVESTTCNIPVISNSSSNLEDYIISGYNGYIVELNSLNKDVIKIFNSFKSEYNYICSNIDINNFDISKYKQLFSTFFE